ncbi:heparinase II/III family protein [Colwelliaceae bacterium 6441]
MKILDKLLTYKRLGFSNMFHVAVYRLAVKLGYFEKKLPIVTPSNKTPVTVFFSKTPCRYQNIDIEPVDLKAFSWLAVNTLQPPNWLKAVNTENTVNNNRQHWSKLNDFDLAIGDIKTVWELSRFHWLCSFALDYLKTADLAHLDKINEWLNDWCIENPINQGVNWKCGQEASIRVMHLSAVAYLLNQEKAITTELADLIYAHLQRIAPTIRYAMAQDNNHGTSEAAALYIGGILLSKHANYQENKLIAQWINKGQYWLENRADKLIDVDGAFSQNSVNYHRLMLDTLSFAEFFRQQFSQANFSKRYYQKVECAINWLCSTISPTSGKTPILGLNDGAQILPLTACDYLDYRPSAQWACALFTDNLLFEKQQSLQQLTRLLPPKYNIKESITEFNTQPLQTSYQLVKNTQARCYLRTPNAQFRPACCDALHVDFWLGDDNIFLSTGSYSYNCEPALQAYFTSVSSHNTVQFDQQEQMPKLSRFLYNDWITSKVKNNPPNSLVAQYCNRQGHQHSRAIQLSTNSLQITDSLEGVKSSAILRWHLPHRPWQLKGNVITHEQFTIEISADNPITKIALVDGYQSRYYLKKDKIPVIEITLSQSGTVTTLLSWS